MAASLIRSGKLAYGNLPTAAVGGFYFSRPNLAWENTLNQGGNYAKRGGVSLVQVDRALAPYWGIWLKPLLNNC